MSENFGLKIGLEGEKAFKDALRDINQSFKVLGSEMNLVASQFDKQDKSVEAVAARNAVLNKEIDEQKNKIGALEKALANASASFGENDRCTQAWAIQLNNAKAALNGMERQLGDNNQALDETCKASSDAGEKLEEAGRQAKASGDDAGNAESAWSKLGNGLAKAGELAAKAAAAVGAAAVAAGTALVGASVSGASYADDILTTATQTGIATDKLQEYKYASELVDVSLDTLTGSMAKNIKSMTSAQKGTGDIAEAYKTLGIQVTDANGNLRDGETVYWEAIDALGNVSSETERDALAMRLFGKSAQDLNPLIDAGAEKMQELGQKARDAGYVLSDEALNSFGAFDDQLQYLKVGAEGAKNALGTVLLPVLTDLAGEGVSLLGEFTKGVADANGDMGKISGLIAEMIPKVIDKIVELLPTLIDTGMQIIGAVGQGLLDNLPTIIDAAVQIIMSLVNGFIEALPQITDGALQLIMALVNGLIENLPAIVEGALQLVLALATGIAQALPELIPAVVDAVLLIVETLIDNLDMLVDAAIAIIVALAEGLVNALPKLIEKVPDIIIKLVEALAENLPKLIEAGIQIIVTLAGALIEAIPKLVARIPEIVTAIVKAFETYSSKIGEIGKNIVSGIWSGIQSMAAWFREKISGFFSGIVSSVKGMLGIQSPSKVFAGIGENMASGLGEGFAEEMKNVARQINGSIPTDIRLDGVMNSAGYGSAVVVNVPLSLDGRLITAATGRVQYGKNRVKARTLGVAI